MSVGTQPSKPKIVYPDSDGKPMADNTLQFRWVVTIQGGLDDLFRDRDDVFVAGDLLWYPVEGQPRINAAPDAMVVFGRPKGDRGSYRQWVEGGIAPQVVLEILSPSNRPEDIVHKHRFYQRYGVEEYYLYNPDDPHLTVWVRQGDELETIDDANGWVSPRLGIRFDLSGEELQIFRPDGERFATYLELAAQRDRERHERERAQREAEEARSQADEARQRAERLAAQLRALGAEPQE